METIDKVILDRAVLAIRAMWTDVEPKIGLILGSGWGEIVGDFTVHATMPFTDISGLGKVGVPGHVGRILRAEYEGVETLVFQGRRHLYEGEGMTPVVLPIWLLKQLGASTVLLTNASGGIREDLKPGSLVAISDHINLLGTNPLVGAHNPAFGEPFPDQTEVYDSELRKTLLSCGADAEGVYAATLGRTFETPAEIRTFRTLGSDLVGMSTVPEAIFANALGMKVAGLSCICNWAAGLGDEKLTHDDVMRVANESQPRMRALIKSFMDSQV